MSSVEEYDSLIRSYVGTRNHVMPVKIVWSVKGYHVFHLRPHEDVPMLVEVEENNPYDPNAMKVIVPALELMPYNSICIIQ